jgi:cell division septal protein FtsQ
MIGTRTRRDKRQRGTGYTGVLRDTRISAGDDRPQVEHSEPRRNSFSWRLVSLAIVIVLSMVLSSFASADVFYVRSVSVGGLKYLTKEEVFSFAQIANMHLFWINPQEVRANLLESSSIADARVWLAWPPQMVNIVVQEREPAMVWEQNGVAFWTDIQGRVMEQRQDRPDLIRIQASSTVAEGLLSDSRRVNPEIVIGALQLQQLLPNMSILRYETAKGLGFASPSGYEVWLGSGANMAEKIKIYESVASNLQARGIQPGEINVVDPDYPFYTVMWGR